MPRKPLMAGNWKMNLNHVEAVGLVQKLAWTLDDKKHDPDKEVGGGRVATVHRSPHGPDLDRRRPTGSRLQRPGRLAVRERGLHRRRVRVDAGQAVATYVLVGHSERRQIYGETDELVSAKARMALNRGLTPIVCVSEGIEVREEMDQVEFTIALVSQALANLTLEQIGSLVIRTNRCGQSARVRWPPLRTPGGLRIHSGVDWAVVRPRCRPASAHSVRRLRQGEQCRRRSWPSRTWTVAWSAGQVWSSTSLSRSRGSTISHSPSSSAESAHF